MTDPEETVDLMPEDLAEVAVDEVDDLQRPMPLEADPADALDQKLEVPADDDYPEA